jgi:hypothetical protein
VAYNFTLYTNLGNSFSPSWCGFIAEVFFMKRRFKVGYIVIRTTEHLKPSPVDDDYEAEIGDKAIITELSERYDDSYVVTCLKRKTAIWEDQNCRAETPLEKAMK